MKRVPALCPLVFALAAGATPLRADTINVDCAKGQSIAKAIAGSKDARVRIDISGTCAEAVVVERMGVTISGTAAGGATIDPPDVGGVPTGPAIRALGAHELTLEDLVLTGAVNGLEASASRGLILRRVSAISNNQGHQAFVNGHGVLLRSSDVTIIDSNISSNSTPIAVLFHSHAAIANTVMSDNSHDGPFAAVNSHLQISRCTMARNGFGPQASVNSRTVVDLSTVSDSGEDFAFNHGELIYRDSTITNMAASSADRQSLLQYTRSSVQTQFLQVRNSSRLELLGSQFQALPSPEGSGLFVTSDSFARAMRSRRPSDNAILESSISGNVVLSQFSDASFVTALAIQGAVNCQERSRLSTNLPPTGGTTGCE